MADGFSLLRFGDAAAAGAALADTVAELLSEALTLRQAASLTVPGGRSPGPFFESLFVRTLDWSKVTLTLTDERWVEAFSADANERLLRTHLTGRPAQQARLVGLKTAEPTPQAATSGLARHLSATLPPLFDAVILGMGEDGHVASLFPGQPLSAGGEACLPGLAPTAPRQRMSLSLERLRATRRLFLLFGGADKLAILTGGDTRPVHRLLAEAGTTAQVFFFAG